MVKFSLVVYSPLRQDLEDLLLSTITMVWQRHMGSDMEFSVTIADKIFHLKNASVHGNGAYDPESHAFYFALENLLHQWPEHTWAIQVVRIAAHEGMHAVQAALGRPMTPDSVLGTPAYHQSPLEVEADQESVDVLKGYIPAMTASLPVGDRLYPPPVVSSYEQQWEEAHRERPPFVVVSRGGPGLQT